MAIGPGNFGFVAFAAVKLVGYTLAAHHLKRMYHHEPGSSPKPILFGLARTILGLAVGAAYGYFWLEWGLDFFPEFSSPFLFFALLLPIRLGEWSLVIWWLLLDSHAGRTGSLMKGAGLGTAWSYSLDAIGMIAALVVPGGIWIC